LIYTIKNTGSTKNTENKENTGKLDIIMEIHVIQSPFLRV